jgi:hypothetical protein
MQCNEEMQERAVRRVGGNEDGAGGWWVYEVRGAVYIGSQHALLHDRGQRLLRAWWSISQLPLNIANLGKYTI